MAPSRVAGGPSQSSAASGIFFQEEAQSQSLINSQFNTSFGNSANSICETGCSNIDPVSGDINQTVMNSLANSGPSVGASSLVTDANSAFSGGPRLQRSASINTDSYLRLPASPMSFTSNNISVSNSSVIDGPSMAQQSSHHHDPNSQQAIQSRHQQLQQRASGAACLTQSQQPGQLPLATGKRVPTPFIPDPSNFSQLQKKPRLDVKQEELLQQQLFQQLLQRQDPMHQQAYNPQLQIILQQQRLRQQQQQQHQQHQHQQQQQQIFQALPHMQRVQLQQQQLRQHLEQQSLQQVASIKSPYDPMEGVCARRLMQYLYHQRQRPRENPIAYWRKFVAEYYAPRAKKRWCLSLYENVGHHALGVFPQAAMDVWHCDICGSKSGRGFEATYEVLPRLSEIKFGSGVIDEFLFLDWPRERRFTNGIMILHYGRAIQETKYEQLHVVREGQLRIVFTQDLKILSWDFCARRHEELLPRRLVAPQVNQLLQVAQKCQSTVADSGSEGVSSQDLQISSNMVVTASRQLAKSLELPALNDLGFSKRYVRCLQIAEVVNSMKDLIDFCRYSEFKPIEALKVYPRHASTSKLQAQRMQEIQQMAGIQGLPSDRNTFNKMMAMHPGFNNNSIPNHPNMIAHPRGGLGGPTAAAIALTNYQNVISRQNSMSSNPNTIQHEASSSLNNSNQNMSGSFQFQGGVSNPQLSALQLRSNSLPQQNQVNCQSPRGVPQHMIQQLLQDMSSNCVTGQQKTFVVQNMNPNTSATGFGYNINNNETPVTPAASSNVSGGGGPGPSLSNSSSFKAASNSDSTAAAACGAHTEFNQKAPQSTEDFVSDLPHDFAENMFFGSDIDDNMGYDWKA